jgi:hypothetical protein
MRLRSVAFELIVFAAASTILFGIAHAQTPAPSAQTRARQGTTQVQANLAQLMRGILLPNSNVVFFAQSNNPADVKPAADPSSATDPLASTYGRWTAVENSALALSEAARLLTVPGRVCSNGRPVPATNADWVKFVQGLRQAGITAFKAAQTKNQDKMLDAADVVTTACTNCHNVYREKTEQQGGLASRCTK